MLPDRNEHHLTGGDSALRTFTDALAIGPYPSPPMITATLGFPNLVPERAAESGTAIPDLPGPSAPNSFAYETPDAGRGPVENASRLPSGARDRTTLHAGFLV